MVDRESRNGYAELIRHLAAGILTADEYEMGLDAFLFDPPFSDKDPALWAIEERIECLNEGSPLYLMRVNQPLNRAAKREAARWILFLYTDLEYQWRLPSYGYSLKGCFLDGVLMGWTQRYYTRLETLAKQQGDYDCWPFLSRADLEKALIQTPLLHGQEV